MAVPPRPVRSRPIRLLLIGMFAIPLVSLVVLWGFAASITINNASYARHYNAVDTTISPSAEFLLVQLSQERQQSYIWLITGHRSSTAPLDAARSLTDKAAAATRSALNSVRSTVDPTAQSQIASLFTELNGLGAIRNGISSGTTSPAAAFQSYSSIVDTEFHLFDTLTQVNDAPIYETTTGSIDVSYSAEMAGREAALVGGALAANGRMSASDRELFASTVANRRLLISDGFTLLGPSLRADYATANSSPAYARLQAMENQISGSVGSNAPIPVNASAWRSASTAYLTAMERAESQSNVLLRALGSSLTDRLDTEAILAGGVGLAAVVGSFSCCSGSAAG